MHLEGEALDLYSWLVTDQPLLLWEDLVQAFNRSFGPAEFLNPDEFLCSVRQTSTVQTYRQEFAKRSARVSNWPDHCLLGVFLNGLKEELRTDVRIHKPRTVYSAMSLALEFEAKANQHDSGQIPTVLEDKPLLAGPTAFPTTRRPTFNLSETEKQARYAKGECFRCGEKFSPGHRCKTGALRLLEANDEEVQHSTARDDRVAEVAEISLQAMMGMPQHSTLIVPGSINSYKVSILIDCGSTHNFVNDSLVAKIGLATHDVVPFGVRIGNGDVIRCNRVCKDVTLLLNDLPITQDLYPFVLGGADVVLGIQWLATLNTVQANWKTMFLKFTFNGKEYKLQGRPPDSKQPATFRHLNIEPYEVPFTGPDPPLANSRLEDKSFVRPEVLIRDKLIQREGQIQSGG